MMQKFFSNVVMVGQHGKGFYHYIHLPKKLSDEFFMVYQDRRRGFRSLKIKATIGDSSWQTSLFLRDENYFLLLNSKVRKAEKITSGQTIKVGVEVL